MLREYFKRTQHKTNWLYFDRSPRFKDVGNYRAFVVDGMQWIKIPLINGVNATKKGLGPGTRYFEADQLVGKPSW